MSQKHVNPCNTWKAPGAGVVTQLKDDLDHLTWNNKLHAEVLRLFADLTPFHPGGTLDNTFNATPNNDEAKVIKETLEQKWFRIMDEDITMAIGWGYTVEVSDQLVMAHKAACKKSKEEEKEPEDNKPGLYWQVHLPSFPPPHM
ncbi:hypothetical protein JCM1840_002062 [Sporobolomyces johnsonii]